MASRMKVVTMMPRTKLPSKLVRVSNGLLLVSVYFRSSSPPVFRLFNLSLSPSTYLSTLFLFGRTVTSLLALKKLVIEIRLHSEQTKLSGSSSLEFVSWCHPCRFVAAILLIIIIATILLTIILLIIILLIITHSTY